MQEYLNEVETHKKTSSIEFSASVAQRLLNTNDDDEV